MATTTFDRGQAGRDAAAHGTPLRAFQVDRRADCGRSLASLVESEIIPRLIDFHTGRASEGAVVIAAADVEAFAPLALQVDADVLLDHVDALLARGLTIEALLVDLLAPAARVLGEYWKADRCDFVDVTMGLWRLQEVIHEVSARLPAGRGAGSGARRALFAALPGDQHGFGAVVVEELFARNGWLTDRSTAETLFELHNHLGGEWYDLIGLTVSCDCHTGALPAAITAIRSVSRNPRLVVMVGGRVFVEDPDLALAIGADGTAADARAAVRVADELVAATCGEGLRR